MIDSAPPEFEMRPRRALLIYRLIALAVFAAVFVAGPFMIARIRGT